MNPNHVTVGILSDSHGYLDPRIADTVNGCDYIVHAGDIFNAGVLQQLQPGMKLVAVAGNNDHPSFWCKSEAHIVSSLPPKDTLELPGGHLVVEHGHRLGNKPDHQQLRSDYATARLIVYGHTHHRALDQHAKPWVVNPGASGNTRTHGGPSCMVLHASDDKWEIDTIIFEL